jgi:hypothetical protein
MKNCVFCWFSLRVYIKMHGSKNREVQLYSSFDLGARRGGWSTPRPSHFTPWKFPVPIVKEAG